MPASAEVDTPSSCVTILTMKLKMFVFTEVLKVYKNGIIVMVAESREEAIELYIEKEELDCNDPWDAKEIEDLKNSHWYSLPLEKGLMAYCHDGGGRGGFIARKRRYHHFGIEN